MTPIKPRESVLTFLGMWYHLYFLSLQWLLVGLKWCICKTLLTKTVLLQKKVLGGKWAASDKKVSHSGRVVNPQVTQRGRRQERLPNP